MDATTRANENGETIMGKVKDLTGQGFGRLTVVKQIGFGNKNKHGSRYAKWLCKCDCGNYCERTTDILKRSRNDHSCGCKAFDVIESNGHTWALNDLVTKKTGRRFPEVNELLKKMQEVKE